MTKNNIRESHLGDGPGERTLWLALGYVEAAAFLCKSLVDDEYTRQFRSTRVILHLAHHAIELFLKGAILQASAKRTPRTHNLAQLTEMYRRHYPSPKFHFEIPFGLDAQESQPLFPEIEVEDVPLSERFRYATGRDGRCFNERDDFSPEEWADTLKGLAARLTLLFFKIREANGLTTLP